MLYRCATCNEMRPAEQVVERPLLTSRYHACAVCGEEVVAATAEEHAAWLIASAAKQGEAAGRAFAQGLASTAPKYNDWDLMGVLMSRDIGERSTLTIPSHLYWHGWGNRFKVVLGDTTKTMRCELQVFSCKSAGPGLIQIEAELRSRTIDWRTGFLDSLTPTEAAQAALRDLGIEPYEPT